LRAKIVTEMRAVRAAGRSGRRLWTRCAVGKRTEARSARREMVIHRKKEVDLEKNMKKI
jgi:hypothetical protein